MLVAIQVQHSRSSIHSRRCPGAVEKPTLVRFVMRPLLLVNRCIVKWGDAFSSDVVFGTNANDEAKTAAVLPVLLLDNSSMGKGNGAGSSQRW